SIQGGRSHQEDRAVAEWIENPHGSGWLLGVFDGHRGAATAETAAEALRWLFAERSEVRRGNTALALEDVFASLHDLTAAHGSGSTASIVFIPSDAATAVLAVLGDSPVAILSADGQVHIGPDHNVRTNILEREAAKARGGVYRGGYLEDSERPGVG